MNYNLSKTPTTASPKTWRGPHGLTMSHHALHVSQSGLFTLTAHLLINNVTAMLPEADYSPPPHRPPPSPLGRPQEERDIGHQVLRLHITPFSVSFTQCIH